MPIYALENVSIYVCIHIYIDIGYMNTSYQHFPQHMTIRFGKP